MTGSKRKTKETVMSYIKQMFESHPHKTKSDHDKAIECITACYSCHETCNVCADACLSEQDVAHQVHCIRTNTDCADVCLATAKVISRLTSTNKKLAGDLLRACITACEICGAECSKHAEKMKHCAICAEACRRCVAACQALLAEPA
ncbi:four-helix bundle copper-binding protein [Verrucomicrobiota bacterium sgz303538]